MMKNLYLREKRTLWFIANATGRKLSTVRITLIRNGVKLRTVSQSLSYNPNLGKHLIGKKRVFTDSHIRNMRKAFKNRKSRGWRISSNGYQEYTTGVNAGRGVHIIILEKKIGRKMMKGEVTHHIDGNKLNNNPDNLMLMTRSEHSRLHRIQEQNVKL
ncbi:MAG: HNH endonuclease signature motif containing protein [Planctomycetota bacterium]